MKSVGIPRMVGLLLLLAAGCGQGDKSAAPSSGSGSPAEGRARLKIAMIAKSSTNEVFASARTGAEAAAKELSAQHPVDVSIDWLTPPTEDGQVQAQKIAQALNQGDQAILISCSDAAKVTGAIDDAVMRKVPVMTFDSDAAESKRFAYYGVDDLETGARVMSELAQLLKGSGKVAILAGNQNAPNLQKRAEGVREEAKKYPQIEIVGTFYHVESPRDAAQKVSAVNAAHPEITGWAMIGGWALFTQSLLTEIDPQRIKVVSVDALPPMLPYVEKGVVPVLLAQPTYRWGYESVKIIADKIYFKKDVQEHNRMELVRVSSETLGSWSRQLKDWGFGEIPDAYLKMK